MADSSEFCAVSPRPQSEDMLMTRAIFIMIAMFAVLYFFMIRPQQKKAKEHKALVEALAKGDEVITAGGMTGKITKVTDDFVVIEVSDNVELRFQKQAIAATLPSLKRLAEVVEPLDTTVARLGWLVDRLPGVKRS